MKIPEFLYDNKFHRIRIYAACGAYHVFMAIVPSAVILYSVLPYIPLTRETLLAGLYNYIPISVYELLNNVTSSIYNAKPVLLPASVILAVVSASSALMVLMRGMDMVYDAKRKDGFIVLRLRACFYVLMVIFTALLSLVIMIYGDILIRSAHITYPGTVFIRYLRYFTVMILLWLFFMLLYKWIPQVKLKYREQMKGAAFSAVIWVLFTLAFSEYTEISGRYGIYGFFGTIMIAMMWIYDLMYFLLIGAYINNRKKSAGG